MKIIHHENFCWKSLQEAIEEMFKLYSHPETHTLTIAKIINKLYQTFKNKQIPVLSNDYRPPKAHVLDIQFCLTNTTNSQFLSLRILWADWAHLRVLWADCGLTRLFSAPCDICHLGLQSSGASTQLGHPITHVGHCIHSCWEFSWSCSLGHLGSPPESYLCMVARKNQDTKLNLNYR